MRECRTAGEGHTVSPSNIIVAFGILLGLAVVVLFSPIFWVSFELRLSQHLYATLAQAAGALAAIVAVIGIFGLQTCQAVAQGIYSRYYSQLEHLLVRTRGRVHWAIRGGWPKELSELRPELDYFLREAPVDQGLSEWIRDTMADREKPGQVSPLSDDLLALDGSREALEAALAYLRTSPPDIQHLKEASKQADVAIKESIAVDPDVTKDLRDRIGRLDLSAPRIRHLFWASLFSACATLACCLGGYLSLREHEPFAAKCLVQTGAVTFGIAVAATVALVERVVWYSQQAEQ